MPMLNIDGQPINKAFNFTRNSDKSAYALRGILHGIVADHKLNDMEMMFLHMWMKSHEHLPMEGDVLDLTELIGDILNDGVVTSGELEDLKSLISCVIEYGEKSSKGIENSINELLGLLLGVSADGKLVEHEFEHIDKWLIDNDHISDVWPASILIERIKLIKADGTVDQDERKDLLEIIQKISGQQFEETGAADEAVINVFSEVNSNFTHVDKNICFTGKFYYGTRNVCEEKAKQNGASIYKKVTKGLDVLVVGTGTSRDWRFQNYGRKIEKAMGYRSNGQEILILSEECWLKYVS